MSKAKAKTTTKAAAKPSPDAELIGICIQYAQAVAGGIRAFEADPDGNSVHSGPASDKCYRRANKALILIGSTKATTAAGISAKARIVPMVLRSDDCYFAGDGSFLGSIEAGSARFYETFAADVKGYADAAVQAEWDAAHAASKGGAA